MGINDPQMRVGTSGSSPALGRNYAANAATAGRALISQGDDLPPIWGNASSPVNEVLYVDSLMGSDVDGTGSPGSPFETIQRAINEGVTLGYTSMIVKAAPGTYGNYADPTAIIPATFDLVVIQGYADCRSGTGPITELQGNIIYNSVGGGFQTLSLQNCFVSAATISTDDDALHDLIVELVDTDCSATITANNLYLSMWESRMFGNAQGTTDLVTYWDDYAWAAFTLFNPTFLPASYSRYFRGLGANVFSFNATAVGVPVGSTVFITKAVPQVRAGDYAVAQALETGGPTPAATDFTIGFHSSSAGNLIFWLTNDARVGGNFNEACQALIFHMNMAAQAPP